MATQDLTTAVNDFIDAFNKDDWQRFSAGLAPDVRYEETGTQRRVHERDAYVQLCQGWKHALPDAKGTIRNIVASGTTVVTEVTWEGTHTGPLEAPGGPLPPSGKQIAVQAALWLTFQENQIQEIHHHLDVLSLLQQIGAIPAPG